MSERQDAKHIIDTLETGGFYIECPCCGEPIRLRDAGLFYLDNFSTEAFALYSSQLTALKQRARDIRLEHKQRSIRSEVGSEAVNIGFILERLAPTLEDFSFQRNDCRALFDPIDYIVFEGLSSLGRVQHIRLIDIKTGRAHLTPKQREIRNLVETDCVEWATYDCGGVR